MPFNGSTANNIILDAGDVDGNRGIYLDPHESNASRRFKLFGGMNASGNATACSWAVRSLVTAVSRDGIHWTDWKNVSEMNVAADTLNLVLWDSELSRYLAFTRRHCDLEADEGKYCHGKLKEWGVRREIRSVSLSSDFFGGCKQPPSALAALCTLELRCTREHCRHTATTRH